MKKIVLAAAALAALTTTASAQRWDRDDDGYRGRDSRREWRDENPGERVLRGAVRGLTGERCRTVVTRHRNYDGDIVIDRRRICD